MLTKTGLRPWKNSRLLKVPAGIPGLGTLHGWRVPIADCRVKTGLRVSLRHHWAPRVSPASAVTARCRSDSPGAAGSDALGARDRGANEPAFVAAYIRVW